MTEIKIIIEDGGLIAAINNLSSVISGKMMVAAAPSTLEGVQSKASTAVESPVDASIPQLENCGSDISLKPVPQYTIAQIINASSELMDAGKVDGLTDLLESFGVQTVKELKQEQFCKFVTAIKQLGAKI